MSDRSLRELERRWRESGSSHDEAHYLKAQVRAGELEQEALERAAHLGHPAALIATGHEEQPEPRWFKGGHRSSWGETLAGWGPEFMQRAALADARGRMRRLAEREEAARDPEHLRACRATLQARYDLAVGEFLGAKPRVLPLASYLRTPSGEAGEDFSRALTALGAVVVVVDEFLHWWKQAVEQSDAAYQRLRAGIRDDLVPWILGRCDPLRLELSQLRIASPCEVAWGSMQGDDRARHCGACERTVYDLSALSRAEAEDLVRVHEGDVCVQFYERADGTKLTTDCPVGLATRTGPYVQNMLRGMIAR